MLKSFVRSATVVTLLSAGAFAAAQDVTPFSHVSRGTSPNVVVDEEAPDVEAESPVVDPADEVSEDTTTTTTTPDTTTTTTAPEATDPDADEEEDRVVPEIVDVPEVTSTRRAPRPAPEFDEASDPQAVSVPDVSREEPKKQKGDHNCDGHLDNGWHNKPAEWRQGHPGGCPSTASTPAPAASRQGVARAPKGDHNGDGHCDNGWHRTAPSTCDPDAVRGDRPETAPGQVKKNR